DGALAVRSGRGDAVLPRGTGRTGGPRRGGVEGGLATLRGPGPVPFAVNANYPEIARRAGHRCEYCHAPEAVFNFPSEVEHIIQASRGGPDDATSGGLACHACNLRKSDREVYRDEVTQVDVPLFHPREQRWEEHFTVDLESGQIHGTTPTGRATVVCLDLNHPVQDTARHFWIRQRILP